VNTVTFDAAATASVTYVGGAGNDVISGINGVANTVTLGNGTNSFTHAASAGIQTVTGGTGVDTITGGTAADVIVGGGGADQITGGAGADNITISGTTSTIIQGIGASGTNAATTTQTSMLTSTFDVIVGATAGTQINLGNTDINTNTLTTEGINLAAPTTDDGAVFARGTYDSAAGTFSFAEDGADSALTYDSTINGGAITAETIILVGFVSGASTADLGVLTLV
jgi:Ca2+-binding RTX toxin-like protein